MNDVTVVVRRNAWNANHHLWNNNGTWWLHYTEHLADYTKRRVRRSLKTRCVEVARQRRDEWFRQLEERPEGETADVLGRAA